MYITCIIVILLTSLSYGMTILQNTSQTPSNDTVSLLLNHFQIFKDLLPHEGDSRSRVKENRPLIQELKDGVPINFNKVPVLIIRKNITTITLEPPTATETTFETVTRDGHKINHNLKKFDSKSDPLGEIKRLEKLVLNLKKEMLDQQQEFRSQFMKVYQPTTVETNLIISTLTSLIEPTLTSLIEPTLTSLAVHATITMTPGLFSTNETLGGTESMDHDLVTKAPETIEVEITRTNTYQQRHKSDKIHPKDIWNQKNPPNSVLIVPQFKFHRQDTTITGLGYSKPKQIIWTNFPTTTPHFFYRDNHFLFNHDGPTITTDFMEETTAEYETSDIVKGNESLEEMVEEEEMINSEDELVNSGEEYEEEELEEVIENTIFHQAKINRPRTFEDPFVELYTITETNPSMTISTDEQTLIDSYIPRPNRRKNVLNQYDFQDHPTFKFDVFDWIFENTGSMMNDMKKVVVILSIELIVLFLL